MVHFFIAIVVTGITSLISYGQSGSEFQNLWQNNKIGYITDQQQDKLFSRADFYNYARVRDDDFSEYLKETWHDYSIFAGLKEEPRMALNVPPVFNFSDLDNTSPANLPFSGVTGFNDMVTGQIKSIPGIRKPENEEYTSIAGTFLFYGQQITLRYDKLLTLSTTANVSEDSVSGFWKSFSLSNSNHLIDQLTDYRDLLGLGDWGYFQLVKAASGHIFPNNRWSEDQMTWALMIRSGFDVRLAFNQNSTTVLFPSENNIFYRQFVVIGQKRYYLDHPMNSQLLVTCQNPFPDTRREIDLRWFKSLNFKGKLNTRKLTGIITNTNLRYGTIQILSGFTTIILIPIRPFILMHLYHLLLKKI
jgi:hypothetical protein